eukprot:3542492-Rhodomonas_salina.1
MVSTTRSVRVPDSVLPDAPARGRYQAAPAVIRGYEEEYGSGFEATPRWVSSYAARSVGACICRDHYEDTDEKLQLARS